MKLAIIFFLSLIVTSAFMSTSYAQTPCPPGECDPGAKYPYLFCDGEGRMIKLCTSMPNNLSADEANIDNKDWKFAVGSLAELSPVKLPGLPTCYEFDESTIPEELRGQVCWGGACYQGRLLFKKSDAEQDLQSAQDGINCICSSEDDCGCTVTVAFSTNPNAFPAPGNHFFRVEHDPGVNSVEYLMSEDGHYTPSPGQISQDCEINCDDLRITLNITKEAMNGSLAEGSRQNTFMSSSFTDSQWWPTYGNLGSDAHATGAMNFVNALQYMMLRLMNASADPHDWQEMQAHVEAEDCGCPGGESLGEGFDIDPQYTDEIADCEKCMVQRLYCPPQSGVNGLYVSEINATIHFDPEIDVLRVVTDESHRIASVFVYSVNGETMDLDGQVSISPSGNEGAVNVRRVPNGTYFISIVMTNDQIKTFKVAIAR